jgi:hypothetical protein
MITVRRDGPKEEELTDGTEVIFMNCLLLISLL